MVTNLRFNLLIALLCVFSGRAVSAADSTQAAFHYIDSFAVNTPPTLMYDVDSIAAYLLRGCRSDMEKARAAFAWEANNIRYDVNGFNSGKIPDQSPAKVIKRRHAVCEGYAQLYKSLCTAMGVEAVIVTGHAKAYGYRPGERFEGRDPNHSWNAVKVGGQWLLLDATWGAGRAEGERGQLVSHKQYTPYFFNVDKYEFFFRHYPVEQQWTLISEPITLRQYEEMPLVMEPLFMIGFSGRDILIKYLEKILPAELPMSFPTTHNLRVVDFPLDGTLKAGTQMDFTIVSDEDIVLAISNDLKKPPVKMQKSGNRYTASLPLSRGDLHIAIGIKGSRFSDILLYKVK
jgi:hypothetical protein